MDNKNIIDQLNEIQLCKCKHVKIGDIFHFHFELWDTFKKKDMLHSILRIIYYSLFVSLKYEIKGFPKTVSLFTAYLRKDHQIAFENIIQLFDNQIVVTPVKRKICLSNLKYILLPLKWIRQMSTVTCSLYVKFGIASLTFRIYVNYMYINQMIEKEKYDIEYLLSYCDVDPISSFFVQEYNEKNITTITLQHGYFGNVYAWSSWHYLGSKSKYFLADSPISVYHAQVAGYKGKAIAVGSPHQLNDKQIPIENDFRTDILGIVMNASDIDEIENIDMIKTIQEYADKRHKKVILKFHPQNHPETYQQYLNLSVTTVLDVNMTIDDFCEMVDVVIICASTVFTTMLKRGKPILLFTRKGHDIGLYEDTNFIKFSDIYELDKQIYRIHSKEYCDEYSKFQNRFLCSGDYKENYKGFFRKIGII